jgi:hypothetical protein
MRLLAKDPADRFADATAVLAALSDDAIHWAPASAAGTGARAASSGTAPPPFAVPLGSPLPPPMAGPAMPLNGDFRFVGLGLRDPADHSPIDPGSRRGRRDQRRLERAIRRGEVIDTDPRAQRIRKFRGLVVSMGCTMVFLSALSLITSPDYFWAIWPILPMTMVIGQAAGRLWADGISPLAAFGSRAREELARGRLSSAKSNAISPAGTDAAAVSAVDLAPLSVLAGPYGGLVRRAALDRDRIRDLVTQLSGRDLALVPNARVTADALAEQVGGLASALHGIDVETPEVQRAALADRRSTLHQQLERASLLLQTLYLDLLRLRMSDASSGADGVASVTEQASALSRDIGYLLGAADELRKL